MNSREKRLARVNPKLLDLMERRAVLEDRSLFVDVARVRKRTGMSQALFGGCSRECTGAAPNGNDGHGL
jgi:hypothetical protein